MSLENKIDSLNETITRLIGVIEGMSVSPAKADAPKEEKAEKPKTTKAEKPKADAPKAAKVDAADTVSEDDLQDLCMKIVRQDRTLRSAVKDIISTYGNARVIGDVPPADFGFLKADLEALL